MVTLDFVQREDDLLAFNKHWMKTSRSYRRQLLGLIYLTPRSAFASPRTGRGRTVWNLLAQVPPHLRPAAA